jgi:nucleotide-binding universal stress UspA family protein
MQRIVVATDGSPGGNRAVDAAAKLARATGCKLLILTVGGSISGAELRQLAGTEGAAEQAGVHSGAEHFWRSAARSPPREAANQAQGKISRNI